ncbi:uncharacterized protein LOC124924042 [Impatiens glandulifera]|uniref:uncharacterized protein LOC124924042 n=1 Tax=Impatiens glandulifera TaxID=253017 RepID=UPI001FB15F14|nr:uncharacterized protein LOC124924042 [Impatiens glandulifera]
MRQRRLPETLLMSHTGDSCQLSMKTLATISLLIFSSSCLLIMIDAVNTSSNRVRSSQWDLLSLRNFSSQIHIHPHILILVTVPWSGESRALTNDISQLVANMQEKFDNLKLMLVYKNREKILTDALGAKDGITVIYCHHSLSYKYEGRLRAQNILSSVDFVMSLPPEEFPLQLVKTSEELKSFVESTDKSLLLVEFCGWTQRLLAKARKNATENSFDDPRPDEKLNRSCAAGCKENQKVLNEKMSCAAQDKIGQPLPFPELFYASESNSLNVDNQNASNTLSCGFEEFQRFESFFSDLMTMMRQSFLPPERLRFGLISESSLLSSLGVEDSGSWFMMLQFAGCPSCSKVIKDIDIIRSALKFPSQLLMELDDDGYDPVPVLPVHKPSLLLFIDRSSDSADTRRKSKEALKSLRELASNYHTSSQMSKNTIEPEVLLSEAHQASRSASSHRLSKLPLTSQNVVATDKLSRMILNKGTHHSIDKIVSHLKGSSMNEILSFVMQQEKETKLSKLAKEAGFQLLSDDKNIKLSEALSVQQKTLLSDDINIKLSEAFSGQKKKLRSDQVSSDDFRKKVEISLSAVMSSLKDKETSKSSVSKASNAKEGTINTGQELHVKPDHDHAKESLTSSRDETSGQKYRSHLENEHQFEDFRGSIFFSDGGYKLLRSLTGDSNIPLLVIIDPNSQQHYVLPEEEGFCFSVLSNFVDRFLNRSLLPYQQSASTIPRPREPPLPPFVNLDFHEMDAIPPLTYHTFSEMGIGVNQSDYTNAEQVWRKDVLVLFSNNWCGFCKKMELVVREIYRNFKLYISKMRKETGGQTCVSSSNDMENIILKFPLIYKMDCTLNDCSMILKSVTQRELYPSLILFPAGGKEAVSYRGDVSVGSIFKFLVDHGKNSASLIHEKGLFWGRTEKGMSLNFEVDQPHVVVHKESSLKKGNTNNQVKIRISSDSPERDSLIVSAGSVLVSTDKLQNAYPFQESRVLIVQVEKGKHFIGLIINKPMNWSSIQGIDKHYYELIKEAHLSLGGPLPQNGAPLVALSRKPFKDQYPEILPNIYFLDQWATVGEIGTMRSENHSLSDYWFFLGFSSWGWDQLFGEIALGAWDVVGGPNVEELLDWPR